MPVDCRKPKIMIPKCSHRFYALFFFIFVLSTHLCPSHARAGNPLRDPIVIQVIHLSYADAEHLASILAPLLSKEGVIVPYVPANTLIVKDRKSVVKGLGKIIKGTAESEGHFMGYQTDAEGSDCLPQ